MEQPTLSETDRVRAHSSEAVNNEIDESIQRTVLAYASKSRRAISSRIEMLEREWDVERTLEINASTLAFTGLLLGVTVNHKWLVLPGIVLPFLFQHALQGWCPPLPVLRNLGVRTRQEIDVEKYALKALRGDFENVQGARAAVEAARV